MKITLLQIEKTDEKWLQEGIDKYEKRLKHYLTFETITIGLPKAARNKSIEEQKKEEAKLLLTQFEKFDLIVLLDENGKGFTSESFSVQIQKWMNEGKRNVCFVIGGPFGFAQEVYNAAHLKICLSQMTFSHQMVRLFFTEQLYRGLSILKGEKYHHK